MFLRLLYFPFLFRVELFLLRYEILGVLLCLIKQIATVPFAVSCNARPHTLTFFFAAICFCTAFISLLTWFASKSTVFAMSE